MKREFLLEMGVITGQRPSLGRRILLPDAQPSFYRERIGLAIVPASVCPFSVSTITMVINVFLILLGFLFIGKEFSGKTVYTSILLPTVLAVLEQIFPNISSMTGDRPWTRSLCAGCQLGHGSAFQPECLFRRPGYRSETVE